MDSISYLHSTTLTTIRTLASTLLFVHQIFGTVAGEPLFLLKLILFLD
jgi:hypothetical protein